MQNWESCFQRGRISSLPQQKLLACCVNVELQEPAVASSALTEHPRQPDFPRSCALNLKFVWFRSCGTRWSKQVRCRCDAQAVASTWSRKIALVAHFRCTKSDPAFHGVNFQIGSKKWLLRLVRAVQNLDHLCIEAMLHSLASLQQGD